ncbi:hypothetical protein RvY_15103-2 [Ramazzottius varieornatus]|uniref:Uncharacterized protein n=1 Tax=Ramazzottius varieornatus TaxID=947166 RepID=A0A1D1VYK6_RAMVA|nr:hypothetical protein RvY_15103-2 [Ramazzottius varieornatus]
MTENQCVNKSSDGTMFCPCKAADNCNYYASIGKSANGTSVVSNAVAAGLDDTSGGQPSDQDTASSTPDTNSNAGSGNTNTAISYRRGSELSVIILGIPLFFSRYL